MPRLAKTLSWIGGWNGRLSPIRGGPTLNPSSSKLGTCQGHIYIYIFFFNLKTLAHKTPFQNRRFWTCVASTWVRRPPTFPTRIWKKVRRHDVIEGSRGRGTLLRRRGPLTHDIQFMWLVKKMKTVQVHFTLDLKGVRDQKSSWLDEKSTWYTTWQQVDSV